MDPQALIDGTLTRWLALVEPGERIYAPYLLSAAALAGLVYLHRRLRNAEDVRPGFLAWLFDRQILWHRSARQDYLFFLVNGLVYAGALAQVLLGGAWLASALPDALYGLFGPMDLAVDPAWAAVAMTVAAFVGLDFGVFLAHTLQHKVPLLWQFHKVHHSAEVLTPVTVYRMHPVDLLLTGLLSGVGAGFALGAAAYATGAAPTQLGAFGVNAAVLLFYLAGYNLRHSHVWLAYPRWLSHLLISPAQHQVHHSRAPQHFDRNMGFALAIWDWAFGTLYVPRGYERLDYGIAGARANPFETVTGMYLLPFRWAWRTLVPRRRLPLRPTMRRALPSLLAVCLGLGLYGVLWQAEAASDGPPAELPSVHLQDLTWSEVHQALAAGIDTVIVPTGGTEQNGLHAILGKHNYVVTAAAERVALALGDALVAPVLAYVPQGDIATREGHMAYPGTISLPEPVFAATLEATAESLLAHGFRQVLFLGDSYGNQDSQAAVAARLTRRHAGRGVRIAHVGDYYAANGQTAWLRARGHTEAEIGWHAGMRDTSELLHVRPEGVRAKPVPVPGRNTGHSGDYDKASAEIGAAMLDLKVEAALHQIRRLRGAGS